MFSKDSQLYHQHHPLAPLRRTTTPRRTTSHTITHILCSSQVPIPVSDTGVAHPTKATVICHDERGKNKYIVKEVSSYPDPQASLERAAGHSLFISLDLAQMFNGFALAEGETRNILAVWVPEHGLIRPTRLIFGTVNARLTLLAS